ncbi:hypothetical protein B0T24DRAFT_404358 [Lasiosphaeria ovina]|uniref:Uncharacterized protein n=1 Tax=Lasiosphaeria ovina TaxID=92902 RepID=A0AAE0JX07_9PEZI|nr:hypothetical protein B0T24DRAFT_404358 [Lasiosphaeria ovina]
MQPPRGSTPKEQPKTNPEGIYLSIYKSKEEWDPIQQHAIATVTDCQVQMLAHRKQGPVLPTLVINIVPDPATDKLRKRRSSRTAGLTATKETAPTTLLFRPATEEHHSLQEWSRVIQHLIQPHLPNRVPLSPITPASPSFTNPFASPRSREPSDAQFRPGSGNPGSRPTFQSRGSNQTYSSRERDRPVTYSESLSLRSRRSDLSSHTSSMNPSHVGLQNYTTMNHPTDLPSPASTVGEYQGEFIEGWTSAQGRSSTLSSPVRGRDSIGSQVPAPIQPQMEASSPPGPRETILDRAFQLRCIPGSERGTPGEEKLSSLARFDALMREADEERRKREANEYSKFSAQALASAAAQNGGLKSAWELDDDSDSDVEQGFDEADEDSDDPVGEMEPDTEDRFSPRSTGRIPPTAQRALDFVAGRHEATPPSRPQGAQAQLNYNREALLALSNSGSNLRPQTGYSKHNTRPGMAQRTYSQPRLAGGFTNPAMASQPNMPVPSPGVLLGIPAHQAERLQDDSTPSPGTAPAPTVMQRSEKRLSASSTKRLSFTEFTKRLSSTSSLLLAQTNTSGSGSRGSNSDVDASQQLQQQHQYSHHLYPRGAPASPQQQQQQQQQPQYPPSLSERERCGWRGSVGVFGSADGGFV